MKYRFPPGACCVLLMTAACSVPGVQPNAGTASPASQRTSPRFIYVADERDSRFVVYHLNAMGQPPPLRAVTGSATDLNAPAGIAVDSHGRTYVSNSDLGPNPRIDVFAAGANGNVKPVAIIRNGPSADGLALDASDELYTVYNGNEIAVYPARAGSTTPPVRIIGGSKTLLSAPYGITIDAGGNLWAAQAGTKDVLEFAAGANGNVAPARRIAGAATTLKLPTDVQVDPADGSVYVMDNLRDKNRIVVFAATANGNVAPVRAMSLPAFSQTEIFRGEITLYGKNVYVSENNIADPGVAAISAYAASGSGSVQYTRTLIINDIALSDAAFSAVALR